MSEGIEMTIKCPKCGKEIPDESTFCLGCGTRISNPRAPRNLSIFSNGKIFLALIFIVLIVGGILIFSSGGHEEVPQDEISKEASEFALNIKDIGAYDNTYNGKTSYTYYLEVLYSKVPSNKDDYIVKTVYFDKNDTELGSTIEGLSEAYSSSKYGTYVGYYTSYNYIDVDHAKLQIIKDDKLIKEYEAKLDKNKIDFEQPKTNNTK